jgi:hypothetical protein
MGSVPLTLGSKLFTVGADFHFHCSSLSAVHRGRLNSAFACHQGR